VDGGRQTVLLHHELPDGTSHYDWMLELEPEAALTSFRAGCRIDRLRPGQRVDVERVADHRRAYLDLEGEVAGGRGRVSRVARGRILALQATADACGVLVAWEQGGPPHQLVICRAQGSRWVATRRGSPQD
jgi:hypothetical protein